MSATATSIYDIPVKAIDGTSGTLEPYKGKVLLIVNVASKCGFTGQYKGLEELSRQYKDRGLVVLGFPCNQFMGQEPGNEEEIKNFCSLKYDVTFPMFAKVEVNGKDEHPLYTHLKDAARGTFGTRGIKWNFTKFLVNREGKVVARFGPTTTPAQLTADIEKLLG
ncbi:MAG: glutathione peroxidase [Gemmataceae bacterium]|nr:glutathione peroxidase [Gemmataceae bacterium]